MSAITLVTSIRRFAILGSLCALTVSAATGLAQTGTTPLRLEVRVFNGFEEVTANTAVQIYATGQRDKPLPYVKTDGALVATVQPGAYDLQALWQPEGKVIGMRWALGMYVERYPGEDGRYITGFNLKGGHGALQLRPKDQAAGKLEWTAAAFEAGETTTEVSRAVQGAGYTLIPLPAGRYDVVVRSGGKSTWLKNLEVVADRTSLHHVTF